MPVPDFWKNPNNNRATLISDCPIAILCKVEN